MSQHSTGNLMISSLSPILQGCPHQVQMAIKTLGDSIGSKLEDNKAKASHIGLCPLSQDGGTDKTLTPGSSMQNALTHLCRYLILGRRMSCTGELLRGETELWLMSYCTSHSPSTLTVGDNTVAFDPWEWGEGRPREWLKKGELTSSTGSQRNFEQTLNVNG